jgi:hypothetical protein
MASHHLIEDYLSQLADHLPATAVEELADGVIETWHRHLATGAGPGDAAVAAIAEFGTPQDVVAAFVAHAPGRGAARTLLATGPLFGVCWSSSLVAAQAWTWSVPRPAAAAYGIVLVAAVACLIVAATSRGNLRRTRWGSVGGAGLIVLDAVMLAAVALLAPAFVWPMFAAVPASLARIALTLRALPLRRIHW